MTIKSFEIEPTRENLLDTITKDILDRNESVWQFVRFCDAQEGKCSIAIDAKWGFGKTFFVRHAQMLIDSFNFFSTAITEDERRIIQSAFSEYIAVGKQPIEMKPEVCVYYDAWSNDNDIDPILSLVYEIIKSTAQCFPFKKSADCKKTAALIADCFAGKNAASIVDFLRNKDPLLELKSNKDTQALVTEFLESLLYEQGDRLIIFIDELDRCKPEYAIQLLERIKHYFSNDRITFVFSINIDELQHTVKRYYGEGFDACRYLDRFFDYRIDLPQANMSNYYKLIGLDNGTYVYEAVCKSVAEYCNLGLREIEKFYRMARVAAYKPTHTQYRYAFSGEKAMQFSSCVIIPIMIGLKMTDVKLYNDFVGGLNSSPLIAILGDGEIAHGFCSALLEPSETYDNNSPNSKMTYVLLKDKLNTMYEALFGVSDTTDEVRIGEYTFSQKTKKGIMKVASMLSEYASYD